MISNKGRTPHAFPTRTLFSKDEAWVIFQAGFLASGEGWNGEHPFEEPHERDEGKRSRDRAYLYAQFGEWFDGR